MQGLDLIIFDCDGVLVDSEIVAARVEARLLSAAGFEITPEEIAERYAGLNFQDILLRIESETGTPFEASLTVPPAKCASQILRLELAARTPSERIASGGLWFDDLAIRETP